MATGTDSTSNSDPFSQFWSDYFARVGIGAPQASSPAPGTSSAESIKQMQRLFLDAMAKYFDDFLRSEQFLSMMKQTMDRSLAFKQQVDQFLTRLHQGNQSPSVSDMSDLAGTLRGIEKRLLDRLEALEDKFAAVEDGRGRSGAGPARKKPAGKRPAKRRR